MQCYFLYICNVRFRITDCMVPYFLPRLKSKIAYRYGHGDIVVSQPIDLLMGLISCVLKC